MADLARPSDGLVDIGARGFLIIGDVHLSSLRPERRKDDYGAAVLAKLSQCVTIANADRLIPVMLGDMFHREVEKDEGLKTSLVEILRSFWTPMLCNVGNHDMAGEILQKGDSLAYLKASGVISAQVHTGGVAEYLVEGARVGLGMTPYGQDIPLDVTGTFPEADGVVWFTHHDLAFQGAYPKSRPLVSIKGCSLVFNGHMHLRKQMVMVGDTQWCNFGSMTRTAIDARDHVPTVVAFYPAREVIFIEHALAHCTDVFDLTGRMAPSMPSPVLVGEASQFADVLVRELRADAARTDSGAIFLEELKVFLDSGRKESVRTSIMRLFVKASGGVTEAGDDAA